MLKTEGYENSELFMSLTPKNGVKASKLYSYKPTNGNGDFVWSRNSTAYRMNQSGVLELMGTNVPRVDYTNTCPELLIEKASTNLLLRSQEFNNASWIKDGTTISINNILAPDETITADKIIEDASNTVHAIAQATSYGVNNYTFSVYAKYAGRKYIMLRLLSPSSGFFTAMFDIENGLLGNINTPNTTANIESVGNGWYRCFISCNADLFNAVVFLSDINSTSPSIVSYTGDGTSGVYLWGTQLEESDYATSYIPTTNTTQTRSKDVCYNTANGYNDADWSVVMKVRLNNIGSSADEPLLALSDGTTDYYFAIYTDSNPKLHFTWYNNPDQDTYSTNDLSNGIVNVGVSFDSVTAEYIIVIDGTLFDSGTLVVNPSGLFGNFSRLDLGSVAGIGNLDADGIIGVQYFNTALIQSDLENLTS